MTTTPVLPVAAALTEPATTRPTLAPIVKTDFARRITYGGRGLTERKECWGARTADGLWLFDREDSPGTPWLVYRAPGTEGGEYGGPVSMFGTLRGCRWYVASGNAQADLDRLLAHNRGEHAERNRQCRKCPA